MEALVPVVLLCKLAGPIQVPVLMWWSWWDRLWQSGQIEKLGNLIAVMSMMIECGWNSIAWQSYWALGSQIESFGNFIFQEYLLEMFYDGCSGQVCNVLRTGIHYNSLQSRGNAFYWGPISLLWASSMSKLAPLLVVGYLSVEICCVLYIFCMLLW